MGTSIASEPLNFFIILICEIWIFFSSPSLTAPYEMVALTTKRINLMLHSINVANIDKLCD